MTAMSKCNLGSRNSFISVGNCKHECVCFSPVLSSVTLIIEATWQTTWPSTKQTRITIAGRVDGTDSKRLLDGVCILEINIPTLMHHKRACTSYVSTNTLTQSRVFVMIRSSITLDPKYKLNFFDVSFSGSFTLLAGLEVRARI
jgi:hypothetical protein